MFLGKEIEIDIEPTDKVERIKERVEEKEGIPPPQQRLIFSGKPGKTRVFGVIVSAFARRLGGDWFNSRPKPRHS